MTEARWLELERVHKLCDNSVAPERDQPGHDPAHKFSFFHGSLSHSIGALTKRAGWDQCGDEMSWPLSGFGEAKSGLTGLANGKSGASRGGQIVVVSGGERFRPRAFPHRHKPRDFAFSNQGPSEARLTWEKLKPLCLSVVDGFATDNANPNAPKPTFSQLPRFTWDEFFSGDTIVECATKEGFGLTMACRRSRLPKGVPSKCLCKLMTNLAFRSKPA